MTPKQLKRCYYYDPQGLPRGKGCPRKGNCFFVHPDSRDWNRAADTNPPAFLRSRDRDIQSRRMFEPPSLVITSEPKKTAPTASELPPPPKAPSFLSQVNQSQPQKTMEDRKQLWMDRTRLMAEYLRAESDESKIKERLQHVKHTMGSSLLQSKQGWWDSRLEHLEKELANTTKHKEQVLEQLKQSETWPVSQRPDVEQGEIDWTELASLLVELHSAAQKLGELVAESGSRPDVVPDSMDVDQVESAPRPRKRQRRESDAQDPQNEIDELNNEVSTLQSRLDEFQNDLIAHADDFTNHLMSEVETKVEELLATSLSGFSVLTITDDFEKRVDKLEKDLPEAISVLDQTIKNSESFEAQLNTFKEDNQQILQDLLKMQTKLEKLEQSRQQDMAQISTLEAAVRLYSSSSRPPTIVVPPEQYLISTLEGSLTQAVRSSIRTNIEELRKQLQGLLANREMELYNTLWDKLKVTYQAIQAIQSRLDPNTQF